jgi:F-type H+-transporting ATPase subunit alpha
MIRDLPSQFAQLLDHTLGTVHPRMQAEEIGTVSSVAKGIAYVHGLTSVRANELIIFRSGLAGLATSINRWETGIILLGDENEVRPGEEARRTHRAVTAATGDNLLGRIVDPLGNPLDGLGPILGAAMRQIEKRAPEIIDRAPVEEPLQTGIKAIDATVPIGRGQRELILGDRQTGKTAIAVSTLCNQKAAGVIGVYCAIGQRDSATLKVIETLRRAGVLESTIIVATSGDHAPGLQYIAPYAATAMAEHFMEKGRDVVIVYDDLTRHARAYRELSLLLRRPPGREAYPGDIFYIHAKLLERATHLRKGGSLTALPIIETQAGNISAYIPTNLISITDGQIYLSPSLFQKGILPAIDIGRSVSRVGGKAQRPAYRFIVQPLKLAYAQFEELESFARFSTKLDETTRRNIERGRRVREILKQDEHDRHSLAEQIAVLSAVTEGILDDVPLERIAAVERAIRTSILEQDSELLRTLVAGEALEEQNKAELIRTIRAAALTGSGDGQV